VPDGVPGRICGLFDLDWIEDVVLMAQQVDLLLVLVPELDSTSVHSFWEWVRKQDVTTQRVAWFLLRIAAGSEKGDQLENFEKVGTEFDPDRVWILEKETRLLMADFILEPSNYID
jgi:hypothetical protein